MKRKIKLKNKKVLILLIVGFAFIIFGVSKAYAFYYQVAKSPIKTTFKLNAPSTNNGYLRAYVYTYWRDIQSNEIAAKNAWTLSDNYIDQTKWKKIGDYYYYNDIVNLDISKENLPKLVIFDSNNLAQDDKYKADFKVVYEMMEALTDESGKTSSYSTWNTCYVNNSWYESN